MHRMTPSEHRMAPDEYVTPSRPLTSEAPLRNITKSKVRVTFRCTPDRLEKYEEAAESAGIPLSAWIMMGLSSYYSNWQSPDEKRTKRGLKSGTRDMWCTQCNTIAAACSFTDKHRSSVWTKIS